MIRKFITGLSVTLLSATILLAADAAPKRKILFFTKSSAFEHTVISWKKGQPSWAEKKLLELGGKNNWEFTFLKDGTNFNKAYLAQFDAVFFYTTGDLTTPGTDAQPGIPPDGKQALIDYVRSGKGFIGTHSASDTFHTNNESAKGPDRYLNHGDKADPYVRMLGGEFIKHGAQQEARNKVIDPKFPGFEKVGAEFSFQEEWYSLKDFTPDIHVLTVIDAPSMKGEEYKRPPYPNTWARQEGGGRVFFTSMGHREDVWTNPTFQEILVGGIKWALGDVKADVTPNIKTAAPDAYTNPPFNEAKPKKPKQ
ncbi:MAG: ThuA domain-containing protein [Verrucomicrobia bacterium]|nr:ThuA domain-containing protein [Verrucomicrobiota bacterium]